MSRYTSDLKRKYKLLKVGLIKWDDIDKHSRELLVKYYGVGE